MRLWGRVAYLFLLAVVVGCVNDDNNTIGPRREGIPKLKIQHNELEVSSGIIFTDSIQTNYNTILEEGKRLLVGQYVDEKFGTTRAQAYTQFRPYKHTVSIADDAELISGSLTLSFDYYQYGTKTTSSNSFTVYELTEEIKADKRLTSSSNVAFSPTLIGEGAYGINPEYFDSQMRKIDSSAAAIQRDEVDSLVIVLRPHFTSKLFEAAKEQSDDYTNFEKFREAFPGITIVAGDGDSKIVGFDMSNDTEGLSKSTITLNYNELDTTTKKKVEKTLVYSLYATSNTPIYAFTHISVDRTGTPLEGLTDLRTEFNPLGVRYYQSGSAVIPLVDFSNILEFMDTIPNIVLNSVELSIDVEDAEHFPPPSTLQLRLLDNKNGFIDNLIDVVAEKNISIYPGLIQSDERGRLAVGERQAKAKAFPSLLRLHYDDSQERYYGDFTILFQTLRYASDEQKRPRRFGIVAQVPWIGASVDRFWCKTENMKLKMVYTVPL